jgi:predicted alpha/beta superfamily hydrolase
MMKPAYLLFTLFAFWTSNANANTENNLPEFSSSPIEFATKVSFHSKILDSTESFNIFLPSAFHESSDEHTYPVIFANDYHGQRFFLTLSGVVKHLSDLDRIPESIVVSLNTGGHTPEIYKNGMWNGRNSNNIPSSGSSKKYIEHIQQELMPYLKKVYRASDYTMLIGVSGSSFFPFYALTHQPEIFNSYIFLAAHDVIGMGFKADETILDTLKRTFSTAKAKTHLYFAVADDDAYRNPRFTQQVQQFTDALGPLAKNGLHGKVDILPNERHYDAYVKMLLGALDMQFPEHEWAPKYRDLIALPGKAMENIDAYYQKLSDKYAVNVLPKGDRWNSVNCLRWVSGQLQRENRLEEAHEVAARWVEYRPNSQPAKDKLAEIQKLL